MSANVVVPGRAGPNIVAGKGGYIQFWNWTGITGTTGAEPRSTNLARLDVVRWEAFGSLSAPPMWGSGSFGAMRRRVVISDWKVHARVWWDFTNPPELVATQGDGMALRLKIGADETWNGTDDEPGLLYEQDSKFIPYYFAPLCVWSNRHQTCPSEGDDDGIVFQDFQIEGDSLLWYVDSQETETLAKAYVAALAAQGEIPNN